MLGLQLQRVQPLDEIVRLVALGVVQHQLQAQLGVVAGLAGVAVDQVGAGNADVARAGLAERALVGIPRHHEAAWQQVHVGAEACLAAPHAGARAGAGRRFRVVHVHIARIQAVVAAVLHAPAVAQRAIPFVRAGHGAGQAALGVLGRARDDVDDAVDRVHAQMVAPAPLMTSMRSTSSIATSCASQKTPENKGV